MLALTSNVVPNGMMQTLSVPHCDATVEEVTVPPPPETVTSRGVPEFGDNPLLAHVGTRPEGNFSELLGSFTRA